MLKNLKRAAAIVLSFAMAIQFGLANSYYVNAEEEPVEPQQEQTTIVENNSEVQEEDANEVAVPETKSVELSYVAEDGTILQAATYRDFDLNYGLNTDSSVMLNFDGYTLKDVIVNNSQTVSADQASLSVTSDLVSVQFVYKKVITETENQTTEPAKTEEKNEDDAEADPDPETEVKEELPEYPAFDQSEVAGDVVVHATAAEGVLPRDSKLVVKRITRKAILNAVEETVSEKNMEVESAVALDVTIQSKDGVEIQPNGFVNISFENVATTAQETNVYHVTNDASTVTEVATNAQSFDADHFSIYVITNENQVPLTTFNFVANGTTVSTQIVKSGDTLIAPTAPDMIGQAFVGWVDEAGNSFTGFGKQAEITETTTRTITARYEAALYVYFLNPDGSQIMRTEKVGDHEAHDFTTVSYEVDSTHKLVGWAAKKNGIENIADKISVPADQTSVNVYAIIKEGYWVSFNSDGGSIVDSQFVLHGDNLVLDKSTTPTKPGYTFDGWYNGLTKVENGATVTSPMNLTAHWKAAEVNYTVIHWWENADDDEYAFHESETKTGLTGSETAAVEKSYTVQGKNIFGESVKDKVFTATTIEQKTIKGDGSTIVNVYYKRKTYTMHFKERSNSRTDYTTITKKWGQSISKKEWPTYNGNGNWQIREGSYYGQSSLYLAYTSTMPMKDSTLWSTSGYYTYKAYYYVRNIEDTNYELHHTDVIKSSSDYLTIGKEDCYAITGFTYSHGNPGVDGEYNNSKFYYTRNSYSLRFINNGKQDKTVSKKYEQSISNENYTPARPSSLLDYYTFDGWYDNELCEGEAFDFNGKKMPAQNVTLYAKWTAKKINLTYNLNNPEGTVDKGTKKVAAGTIASTVLPSASAIEGYSFAGWYVADENGHMTNVAFNANDAILKDTNVIGKWLYNGELKVKYVADGVEAPKDNNVYAGGAKATVANGVTKEGKKFLGWQLDGNVYQPGQNFEVNKDLADDKNVITLTAVFGDSETSAILTYHPGYGNGEDHSVAILNNKEVTLKNTSDLSYTAPGEDYYFAGWATSMEDAQKGNDKYAVGDKVRVNADSSNDLYATWVKKTVIEVTANSNTLQYNGEVQKVEGIKDVTAGYEVTGLTAEAKGKDFGTYNTEITGIAKVTKDGVDVTDKVIVNKINGKLTISKREVTLTSETDSKPYDGTPLTRPDVTITGGFVKDEVKEIQATGSVTNVSEGEVTNTITYNASENFNPENYSITKNEGTLSITPVTDEVTVRINGNKDTATYNGTEQSVSGYTVESISNTLYTSTDFTLNGQAKATGKDATTYQMNLDATQFVNNNTNFSNVKFEIAEDGQLVINPCAVTLTSEKASKPYDGTPLTRPDVKIEGNFVDGEVTKVEATGSVTYVSEGEVTNTIVITEGENFKATNYSITKNEGTLSITEVDAEVTVTIKGHEDSVTYDGKPHSVEGYEITDISNKLYTKDDVQFTGEAKAEGTEAGTYQMHLTKDLFSNKNSNFKKVTFVVEDGSLTINPKSITPDGPDTPDEKKTGITVTAPEGSKYDGEEHKNKPTVTDTKTDKVLVEGTDYTLAYSKDVINAGTVTVTVKGIGNYEGSFEVTYEITKRNVTLTSGSASKVYDKTALTKDEVTVSGDGFAKDEGATYKVTGSRTKVGTSKNTFTYELKSNTKVSNYNIEVKFGDLIVTAEDGEVVVTITGRSDSVEYDGNEKSVSGYEVTITEGSKYTTDDFTFNGTAEAKGTEAGTYPMNLAADQFANTNTNYEKVRFVVNDGSLTITPKSINPDDEKNGITVTDPENSIYDGNEHINGLTVTDSKLNTTLVEGTDYTLTYSGDLINVGTVTITVKGIGNYTGEFIKTYQILPREYTVTTNTDSKVYDGTALTAGGTVNNLVDGETVNLTMTGSQTDVGTSDNTYELNWTGSAKESNYTHGKDSIGTLTVTKQSIAPDPEHPETYKEVTITSPSDEVYDGKEHKWIPTVTDKEENELVAKTDYKVTYSTTDFTNVTGTITVTITGIGNYTGKAARTYSITPKTYTVTTESDSRVYDGTALTAGGKVSGIVKGETVEFTITGSQTSVGTSDNTYELNWTGSAKESNYKHGKDSIGTLTVKAKSIVPDGPDTPDEKKTGITVSDPSDSKYDGKEHREVLTVQDTKTDKKLVAEKDYSVTYSDDLVNAGTVTITIEGIGNYTGSFTKTYEITKRSVTLTSATASKTYDGQASTSTSITVSGDGFVKGEGATYNVTGTQTEVGNSANSFEYKLNENTLASNYDITKVVGTLTVTRDTTPVTPAPTPTTPSVPPVVQRVVPTPTPVPEEKVEEEQTPKAEPKEEEKVEEDYTPKATQEYYWALINLICAIVTVLFGLLLLISKRHKDEDDEEEDDETKQQATTNEDEEQEQEKKRGLFTRVLAVLIAIVSVVFFLVTEDMSLAWTWTDQWTIWMVVIGLVQIVVFFVGRKWKNVDNDDDDEEAQQA